MNEKQHAIRLPLRPPPNVTVTTFPFREAKRIARFHNYRTSSSSSESHRSSSSSSSLVPHFCSKRKILSKIPDKPLVVVRSKSGINPSRSRSKASKENDFPTSISRKLKNNMNHSNSLLCPQQSGKTPTTSSISVSRSNISCSLKKSGSGIQGCSRVNSKVLKHLNNKNGSNIPIVVPKMFKNPAEILNGNDKDTPLGARNKTDSAFESTSAKVELEMDSFSGEKTPPIEASVSPEIQCGTASKGLVVSAATPVCYGAGHLLSGIRDKRKCRPRGLLIIGEMEETDLSGPSKITATKEENSDEICPKSRPSFVPPPVEASMRWLSSPNEEFDEVQKGYVGTSSPSLKNSCQVLSDFVSDRAFQSERFSSFQGFSGSSDGDFLSPSSQKLGFEDEASCFQKLEKTHRSSSTGKKCSFSTSSLSCGNVVQTPTSDLSSEKAVSCIYSDSNQTNKLDLDADIPVEASISARTQMPLFNHTDYPSLNRKHHHNKLKECASWVSDSTLASMSLSRMRISWREGLANQTFNTEDELDCYRCLSDEKNDCEKANLDSVAIGGSDLISTTLLKLDSSSVENRKDTSGLDVSAESICIDGDSLAASGDSDWTRSYKFQV